VQNVAATLTPAETSPSSIRYFSARLVLPFLFFGALWFILCRQLSGEWSVNAQYNYGWFVPVFSVYLFWLRWQDRPEPEVSGRWAKVSGNPRELIAALLAVPALFLLLPVRLFEIANPEWRPLGWVHAVSVAALTLLHLWWVGGKQWLRHFAFPVAFFFVAVPWVTPIEAPIIQGLMRVVAAVAAETVSLFGIPTQLEGNLIRVTNGLVGVNEACSGVRSLQTALMIGLLFGELKRLSSLRRIVLVVSAIGIALTANSCRAVFLVWIAATENISEVSRWHALAGYTIVGLVFLGTLILATLLGQEKSGVRGQRPEVTGQPPSLGYGEPGRLEIRDQSIKHQTSNIKHAIPLPASYLLFALCWIVAVEFGARFWYRVHESNLLATIHWEVQWPEASPNFRELKIDEEVRRQLRFDQGHAASWTLPVANPQRAVSASKPSAITCLLYFFRWNPGRNSTLLANLHRPDVCLPAIGWTQVADIGVRYYAVSGSFALPFRHFEFQHVASENSAPQIAHAFYCLLEDRVPAAVTPGLEPPQMATAHSTWTRDERIRQVLEGRRHLGQQVMEIVFLSKEPLSSASAESRLCDLVGNMVSVEGRGD
jgi:exosortase